MAELGDLLTGGSRAEEVTIEMLDYDFLDKCTDHGLIRAIVLKLKSGQEGHYPQLVKHAETRLLQELPQAERSKILRMKAEPQPDDIYEAVSDLQSWEEEMALKTKERITCLQQKSLQQKNAPKWTAESETDTRNPKVMELSSHYETTHGHSRQRSESGPERTTTKKIDAYNFRGWENYDADEEIKRMENEEEEQHKKEHEVIASAKVRAKEDRQRRAKFREDQLREEGESRYKESLLPFEKKLASEKERLKGNESFNAKEYDEAFRCYTCSIALDDGNAILYSNRAAAAHKLQRFDQAEDDCTRAIFLDANFKRAWMRRGMVRYSRGKYAGSVADFTEALRLDPDDDQTIKLRKLSAAKQLEVEGDPAGRTNGEALKKGGRLLIEEVDTLQDLEMESEEPTSTMVAAPPPAVKSKRSLIGHGWMEIASEGVKSSGSQIQALVDSVDESRQVRRVMVSCDGDEDYKDAAKHADIGVILLAEDPDQSERDALAAKARAQYAVGDFNAAKMTFLEAEKCDQLAGRCQHANNVSACMLQLEDYEGVLEQTERVLEVDPCNEKAIYRRWLALKGLGNEVDSASLLSRLGLSDDHGDEINGQAGANRSSVAVDEDKRQEQCDELRKRGNEMMQKDQQENAVELYTEALKENPMDVATSNNRAQAYLNLKRYADAEKDATFVLQAEPTNIKARYRRGRARFNLPQPDKEGGCLDLAKVVSENPGQNEAVNLLAEAVEGMDLDIDDSEVFPEEHNSSNMPKEEKAKSNDETSSGDGSSGYEEMAIQDKEVILGPSTGAHPQANKRPGSLMIVEDDECGGCSWCPVVVDDREEDRQAAVDCWKRGEQFRSGKQWGEALELYARGVVANPSNAKCWIGISRVHRELGNYLKSEEAATRAQNTAPTCALLCKAVTHLDKSNQLTQEERVQYVEGIMQKLEGLPVNGTGGNNIEEPEFAEEWGILNGILPLSETDVCR